MKKFFILILGLSIVVIVLSLLLSHSQRKTEIPTGIPTPTPVAIPGTSFQNINYSNIFPDTQAAQSVQHLLKNPIAASSEAGFTVVSFPTDTTSRPNQVYEQNNTAQYIVQQITSDNTYLTDFLASHPNSQSITVYDTESAGSGFVWYVYPQDGEAFLANKEYGYALKILYFPTMSQETFLNTAAKTLNLSTKDPDQQNDQTVTD